MICILLQVFEYILWSWKHAVCCGFHPVFLEALKVSQNASRGWQEKRRDIWQTPDLLQDLNFIQRSYSLCLFSLSPFMCVFVRTKSQDKKRWKTKAVRSPGSSLIIITNSNLLWGPRNSILNSRMAFNYVRSLKLRIFPSLHMKWKQS